MDLRNFGYRAFDAPKKQLYPVGSKWSDDHDCTLSLREDRYIISKSKSTILEVGANIERRHVSSAECTL